MAHKIEISHAPILAKMPLRASHQRAMSGARVNGCASCRSQHDVSGDAGDSMATNPDLTAGILRQAHTAVASERGALGGGVLLGQNPFGHQPLRERRIQTAGDRVFRDADGGGKSAHFEVVFLRDCWL